MRKSAANASPERRTGFHEDTSVAKSKDVFYSGRPAMEPEEEAMEALREEKSRNPAGKKNKDPKATVQQVLQKVADDMQGTPISPSDAAAIRAAEEAAAEASGSAAPPPPPPALAASELADPDRDLKGPGRQARVGGSVGEEAEAMAQRNLRVGVVVPALQKGERGEVGGYAVQITKAPYAAPYTVGDALQRLEELHVGEGVPVTRELGQRVQHAEADASPMGVVEKGGVAAHFQSAADKNDCMDASAAASGAGATAKAGRGGDTSKPGSGSSGGGRAGAPAHAGSGEGTGARVAAPAGGGGAGGGAGGGGGDPAGGAASRAGAGAGAGAGGDGGSAGESVGDLVTTDTPAEAAAVELGQEGGIEAAGGPASATIGPESAAGFGAPNVDRGKAREA